MKKQNKFRCKFDKYGFKSFELSNKDKIKRLRLSDSYKRD